MSEISRRNLFRAAGALGAATALPARLEAQQQDQPHVHQPASVPAAPAAPAPYRFFNALEASFVESAVDRLIPPDPEWPGAVGAGVPTYIDQQLAGAYGQGARLYRSGPWEPGLPSQGYQLGLTPAQLYRISIAALERELARRASSQADGPAGDGSQGGGALISTFAQLAPADQDAVLSDLEAGRIDLSGFSSAVFFDTLLANTIEGFFSDPIYGGNRDMAGWRMIGFPGAYASFLGIYENHGQRFRREPMSIAQSEQVPHAVPAVPPNPGTGGPKRG